MPPRKSHRLVVDTNVWVSYLLTRSFARLNTLLAQPQYLLLYSEAMINELMNVIERPRIRKQIALDDAAELLRTIELHAHQVRVTSRIQLCRDPDDDKVLELCLDGAAHLSFPEIRTY